jgi:anti-sigma regulatory factor (Ser/Thr protein kinase)
MLENIPGFPVFTASFLYPNCRNINMRIHIPNSAWIGNIDPFIGSFDVRNEKELIITSHRKWIAVHPAVICMLVSLGRFIKDNGGEVKIMPMTTKTKPYFERIGFFKFLDPDSGMKIKEHESSGRFIPLTYINDSIKLDECITEMIPLLHADPKKVEPIRYVISELVRNVMEHARAKEGALVCAQYYQKTNTIRIGVSDTGVGIRRSLNQAHPEVKTHMEAIRKAMMPGISGTTRQDWGTDFNAGVGLFFIKAIAQVNRNFFMIYSGNALYKLLKVDKNKKVALHADPFEDKHSKGKDYPFWHGTVVGVDITLEETSDFVELLDTIREFYRKHEIKRPKSLKFKRPVFINGD